MYSVAEEHSSWQAVIDPIVCRSVRDADAEHDTSLTNIARRSEHVLWVLFGTRRQTKFCQQPTTEPLIAVAQALAVGDHKKLQVAAA